MLNQIHPSMMDGNGMPQDPVMQNLFPVDRPSLPESVLDQNQPKAVISPTVLTRMPVDTLVDMEICDMVNDRHNLSLQWRQIHRQVWDKCWSHMKGVYDKTNKQSWQSTTFMHLTNKVVEIIVANLHGAMFGPEVPIEWQSRRPDMDQQVRSINELIQTDMDKCSAKAQFTDFLRNVAVCGTAVGEVGYIKQEDTVMIKERQAPSPIDGMLKSMGINTSQETFVPKRMLVKDYATITNCDLYDIYPQPRIAEFSKDTWVVHVGKITNKELVMGSRDPDPYYRYDNVTNDLLEGSGLQRVDQDPEKQTRRFILLDYQNYNHFLDPDREHELKTFYGQIPIWYLQPELRKDPKRRYESVPGWIQVVDGQWVIRKRISPWRDGEPPYFKGNYIRVPSEFYGIGVAELCLGYQIEKNEIRNSRMDNINLAMNKIMAVVKDMIPPGEFYRLKSEPGALWMFKGVDDVRKAIQQVEIGDVTKDSWLASKEIDQEAQEATGAVKATIGVGGGDDQAGGNTFRGQLLNKQVATERFMLYARVLETMGLCPAIKKFYHRIYQFKSYQDAQEVLGGDRAKNFQFIAPEELEKVAKLVPLGVMTLENKGVRLAQMAQFSQQWNMQPWFKALEMARMEWVEMGFPEPDSVLFSDIEMQQYNQFKQMMLGQAQGMDPLSMPTPNQAPKGLVGPNGQPLQSGQRGNVPGGQPVSGNVPGPTQGQPRPAMPARGPGASVQDLHGMPLA